MSGVLFFIVSLPWDTYLYVPITSEACIGIPSGVFSDILQSVLCNYPDSGVYYATIRSVLRSSRSAMMILHNWHAYI